MTPRAALVALAAAAWLQSPFRVETRLVVLRATVRSETGDLVTNLERDAFTVRENGKRQPISLFRKDDVPVSIGLLIDNSGSMRTKRAKVEAAALAFARASNPLDELFVVNFADKPRLDVPFTSDLHLLEARIARVDSIGGTAMRDAVGVALEYLRAHARHDRRVLVIVTDGNDNASVAKADRLQTESQQNDVAVYAIGLLNDVDPSKAKQARRELDRLCGATGGAVLYPGTLEQIDMAAVDLARQIRTQYTIGYAPVNQALDGSFRAIAVSAKSSSRLTVHTKAGYLATPGVAAASSAEGEAK